MQIESNVTANIMPISIIHLGLIPDDKKQNNDRHLPWKTICEFSEMRV